MMNEVLCDALRSNRIGGAYLLAGFSDESANEQIDAFLMTVFCKHKNACGECSECYKYRERCHPDILFIRREKQKKSIGVDAVQEVLEFAAKKSFEGGFKAIVIKEADLLTPEAQNALLKVLEEPPPQTVFFLTAVRVKNILPTILSRCIIVRACFSNVAAAALKEGGGLTDPKAQALSRAAKNDPALASEYLESGFFEIRADMTEILNRIFTAKSSATTALVNLILKYESRVDLCFDILMQYLSDLLLFKYAGTFARIVHSDLIKDLEKHSSVSDYVICNTQKHIQDCVTKIGQCTGLNKKLALENLFFRILEDIL